MASRLYSILLWLSFFLLDIIKLILLKNAKEINSSFLKHYFHTVDILIFIKILHFCVSSYVLLAPAF